MASNQYYRMSSSCIGYIELHPIKSLIRDLTFLPQICWRFNSCGTPHCVVRNYLSHDMAPHPRRLKLPFLCIWSY